MKTEAPELTWKLIWEQIELLAEERPDHVDGNVLQDIACKYLPSENSDGCIVGQALTRLGVPPEVLRVMDTSAAIANTPLFATTLRLWRTTPEEWRFAKRVVAAQNVQDGGRPWGEAVDRASRSV